MSYTITDALADIQVVIANLTDPASGLADVKDIPAPLPRHVSIQQHLRLMPTEQTWIVPQKPGKKPLHTAAWLADNLPEDVEVAVSFSGVVTVRRRFPDTYRPEYPR